MDYASALKHAIERINLSEQKRFLLNKSLSELPKLDLSRINSNEVFENRFFFPAQPALLNHKIAGIDSGFTGFSLYSIELVLVKAIGTVFSYENGKLVKSDYFPNSVGFPIPFIAPSFEKDESMCSQSLHRIREELNVARQSIEKFKPNYCLLNGSIVPQYADKPRKDSPNNSMYNEIVQSFEFLFQTAVDNECELIACVEDSRGTRLREILKETILGKFGLKVNDFFDNCFDSVLLDGLMKKGERTMCFSYTNKPREHPIINDFSDRWQDKIMAFYLKASDLDKPIRIEFLCEKKNVFEKANELASIVFSLSSMHREYSYPSVLIEADLRAKLRQEEISTVFDSIIDKVGRKNHWLSKRHRRPFS